MQTIIDLKKYGLIYSQNMNDRLCSEQTVVDRHTTLLPEHPRTQDNNESELGGDNERSNRRISLRLVHLWPTFCHLNRPATFFLFTPTFSYSHYNLLNNVKVYMHEGSKRSRGDRIYIIGLSLSPSGRVFIIFPSSFLM